MTAHEAGPDAAALPVRRGTRTRSLWQNLTGRLLILAGSFILLAEAFVFIPSVALFRDLWLAERFDTGELAVMAARMPDGNGFRKESAPQLLRASGIISVTMVDGSERKLLAGRAPPTGTVRVDLEQLTLGRSIGSVVATLTGPADRTLLISGRPRSNAALRLEVVIPERQLQEALWRETGRVVGASLALAVMIAALIYSALADSFVRPMRRLTMAILRFRDAPFDASNSFTPSGRADEIGDAEDAFADMQEELRQSFLQRERLAQLGVAVSKISHDLRHSLGTAQLVSERLSQVDDPQVRAAAPRLERALERAVTLAESTLRYGRADERAPAPEPVALRSLLDEVAAETLADVAFVNEVGADIRVMADADHMWRLFSNLIRNAGQALLASGRTGEVRVSAEPGAGGLVVRVADTGPGLPDKVRARLFEPFAAGGLSGGTGLGLAIARDLARMNGGDLSLASTGPDGTAFEARLRTA